MMNLRAIRILSIAAVLAIAGVAGIWLSNRKQPAEVVIPEAPPEVAAVEKPAPPPKPDVRVMLPPEPEPTPEPEPEVAVLEPPPPPKVVEPPKTVVARPPDHTKYWEHTARQFNQLMGRLNRETDPRRRQSLINALSRYVRVDTLSTLDWAMSLEDPTEKRAALEAINQNALNGIGARIEMNETGVPRIRETTILSAIGSTGKVEPGDNISGIRNPDGTITYMQGKSIQQVVQLLRGTPGTQVELIMERPGYGNYNVQFPRSMIVVGPPF